MTTGRLLAAIQEDLDGCVEAAGEAMSLLEASIAVEARIMDAVALSHDERTACLARAGDLTRALMSITRSCQSFVQEYQAELAAREAGEP